MAINWFWDALQCKWPDPKPSVLLLASKGTSLVSRVSVLRLVPVLYMHLGHISSVTKHGSCDPALISERVKGHVEPFLAPLLHGLRRGYDECMEVLMMPVCLWWTGPSLRSPVPIALAGR